MGCWLTGIQNALETPKEVPSLGRWGLWEVQKDQCPKKLPLTLGGAWSPKGGCQTRIRLETKSPPCCKPLHLRGSCIWPLPLPWKGNGLVARSRCPFIPMALERRDQMEDKPAFGRLLDSLLGISAPYQSGSQAHRLGSGLD